MLYNKLPHTSFRVSRFCLGTMMFGGQTSEEDAMRMMDEFAALGGNFLDTANVYQSGETECIVGKWLKSRRHDMVLATKVCGRMGDGLNDEGLSRANILYSVEESLRRLDTDYIDIYYLHAPDYGTDIEETLYTMDGLVRSGKVRYVGASNCAAWQLADMRALCEKRGYAAPIAAQNVYNLLTRGAESEFFPYLDAHPMGLCVYNPLAGGLLTGKYADGKILSDARFAQNSNYYNRYWTPENLEAARRFASVAAENNMTPVELALSWTANNSHVTSVICGVSRPAQLAPNAAALQIDALPDGVAEACDEIWRGLPCDRFAYNR